MLKHILYISFFIPSFVQGQTARTESAAYDYIDVYRKYIGGVRGGECPMYPSCSTYGLQAFREGSFIKAVGQTCDRLIRCGHDHRRYPLTLAETGPKLLDLPNELGADLIYRQPTRWFAYVDRARIDSNEIFINFLINNQRYQEALLEIERLIFF